jgi:hypothetical protein
MMLRYYGPCCWAIESLLELLQIAIGTVALPCRSCPLIYGYAIWQHARQGYALIGSIVQHLPAQVPLQI